MENENKGFSKKDQSKEDQSSKRHQKAFMKLASASIVLAFCVLYKGDPAFAKEYSKRSSRKAKRFLRDFFVEEALLEGLTNQWQMFPKMPASPVLEKTYQKEVSILLNWMFINKHSVVAVARQIDLQSIKNDIVKNNISGPKVTLENLKNKIPNIPIAEAIGTGLATTANGTFKRTIRAGVVGLLFGGLVKAAEKVIKYFRGGDGGDKGGDNNSTLNTGPEEINTLFPLSSLLGAVLDFYLNRGGMPSFFLGTVPKFKKNYRLRSIMYLKRFVNFWIEHPTWLILVVIVALNHKRIEKALTGCKTKKEFIGIVKAFFL